MSGAVAARAFANIALSKYWGKKPGSGNGPATPSLSLALDVLRTETNLQRCEPGEEEVVLDGEPAEEDVRRRLLQYVALWRSEGLLEGSVSIQSRNHFPTAAGLASSASGFAAIAAGLAALATRELSGEEVSRMARRGSGSAARSIPGGLARMPAGEDPAAERVAPAEDVPFGMVVAVVDAPPKKVGSTLGMERSRTTSLYYPSWLVYAERDELEMQKAFHEGDLKRLGERMEANALAMHALMLATRPGLLYWSPGTVALLHAVRAWREEGVGAWATMDAGPHVCFLARREDLEMVAGLAGDVQGVRDVLVGLPAEGATAKPAREGA